MAEDAGGSGVTVVGNQRIAELPAEVCPTQPVLLGAARSGIRLVRLDV